MKLFAVVGALGMLAACDGDLLSLAGPAGEAAFGRGQGAQGDEPREFDIPAEPDGCISTRDYFNDVAQPGVFSVCVECHLPGGASAGTRFVLFPDSVPGYLTHNYDVVDKARTLTIDDEPLLIAKPTGAVPHGGHTVIEAGSVADRVLRRMLDEMAEPVACAHDDMATVADVTRGLTLLEPTGTLRKAMLSLVGRVPSPAEKAAVQSGGMQALDTTLLSAFEERGFHDRLIEIFNDVFLTDQLLSANGGGIYSTFDADTFPNLGFAGEVWTDAGERVVDSMAREPLELVAHVVMNDRPLTEIVTAQYRVVNPLMATALSLDVSFDDPSNQHEWRETQIAALHQYELGKSEYAGIMTTNAWLKVVSGASTNRNRRRARYVYKWLLDFDIMKTATRIDFSTVDFTSNPWLNNPSCTGCHAKIDPVAGLFQNWTNCYDAGEIRYFPRNERYCGESSWWPEGTMFQPGLSEGHTIDPSVIPEGLEALADHIIEDPGFARAMVKHVFAGVVGRPVLDPPQNTADPEFGSQQTAYDAETAYRATLEAQLVETGFDTKALILSIVKSPYFRAIDADEAGRTELRGMGAGGLVIPEAMHRKLLSIFGESWGEGGAANGEDAESRSPYYLRDLGKYRLHAGGIDSKTPGQRLERPSGLTSAVFSSMAFEVACHSVARDFSRAKAMRRLFPDVDPNLAPSGDATAASQVPILKNLQHLHSLLLGEELTADSPELIASYTLLHSLVSAGAQDPAGLGPCSAATEFSTGNSVSGGISSDPSHVLRAWQGVVTYLLLDPEFLFE